MTGLSKLILLLDGSGNLVLDIGPAQEVTLPVSRCHFTCRILLIVLIILVLSQNSAEDIRFAQYLHSVLRNESYITQGGHRVLCPLTHAIVEFKCV
jgi:hypothetical protein